MLGLMPFPCGKVMLLLGVDGPHEGGAFPLLAGASCDYPMDANAIFLSCARAKVDCLLLCPHACALWPPRYLMMKSNDKASRFGALVRMCLLLIARHYWSSRVGI
mmetsp:Transcript_30639/g.93750  ORF Transcript_30639/g.93750 Transcript_30639/m.93750 type:complete len:105 (-) Transcript_30639:13-327(-)